MVHMVNAMNKVLRDCISDITMPFRDDITDNMKDETVGEDECQKFVVDDIADCKKILQRLEGA